MDDATNHGGTESPMHPAQRSVEEAAEIMTRFAERTGLGSDRPPRRYLWTDAFAVCNFLGLARCTGDASYTNLALGLAEQVHDVLGSYRADDQRVGRISGLSDEEGRVHPTRGGLRIGKPLPERAASDRFDERLEWERDGQYFHYLTKWMHALDQVARRTGNAQFNTWARELAEVAHSAFSYSSRDGRRMVWKMSTDLRRPLVNSMGHHDPLDGLITCVQLQTTRTRLQSTVSEPTLETAADDFATMVRGQDWTTADPLGLGGLLMDASRVAQLMQGGAFAGGELLDALLSAALPGLFYFARQNDLGLPASQRLAFRELGLAIGLAGIGLVEEAVGQPSSALSARVRKGLEELRPHVDLGSEIQSFWLDPEHREARSWSEHRDINEVMLATSLVSEGFLRISG
jgi:hypothetical protein